MMKNKLLCLLSFLLLLSCNRKDDHPAPALTGTWKEAAPFPGPGRRSAFGFVLNNQFYVGMGDTGNETPADFYQYNAATDSWLRKADVPAPGRLNAISFTANGKGYVGLGFSLQCASPGVDCTMDQEKALWEYDPALDSWKKVLALTELPPSWSGQHVTAFTIADKAYIVAGNELWEYDPAGNRLVIKANCPESMLEPVSFALNNKGYVTTVGQQDFFVFKEFARRFYEYDPVLDTWKRKADFAGEDRSGAVAFSLKGRGYLCGGQGTTVRPDGEVEPVHLKDMWQYDPALNQWRRMKDYPGPGPLRPVAGGLSDRAVIGLGATTGALFPSTVWQFLPE